MSDRVMAFVLIMLIPIPKMLGCWVIRKSLKLIFNPELSVENIDCLK